MRYLGLGFLCLCIGIILMGCGGDSNSFVSPSPQAEFVITEWRFVNSQPVKKVLVGNLPAIETGVQFQLQLRTGTELIPVTSISNLKFFKNKGDQTTFEEFTKVISWEDGTVGRFFRIDQQFLTEIFEVRGVFKGCPVTKKFRVLCPTANPDP